MRLEGVDPEREVLAVELERPDGHEGDRRTLDGGAQLRRVEPFVAKLGQGVGGWKSSSEMPS